ncbi:hypothetical protein JTB14_014626 [Gonioctena quinquepunctata]|nr:hypothetical protein JTB14_014626 [Gonioctena quinquepunctata]
MQSSSRASRILEMAKLMKEDNINESKNVTNKNLTEDAKPEEQVISGTDPEVIKISNTAASNPEHSNVMRKLHTKVYCISPTHSNESDIDDSDEDPDFQDCSSNSSDSSSDSSDSSSDSSSSRSDEESDHVIVRSTGVRDKTQVQATMEEEESTKDNSNIIAECNQDKKNEQNSQNIGENEESRQNARGIQEDQCDLCETCKNSEKKKLPLRPTYDQHQSEKEMARIEKKNDKDDINKPHVIVYDLQAVMPVPKGHAFSFYYKSKLNCINLTICDLDLKNVDCYFWDATQAKRGSIEIGSCVLQYLNSLQ